MEYFGLVFEFVCYYCLVVVMQIVSGEWGLFQQVDFYYVEGGQQLGFCLFLCEDVIVEIID